MITVDPLTNSLDRAQTAFRLLRIVQTLLDNPNGDERITEWAALSERIDALIKVVDAKSGAPR